MFFEFFENVYGRRGLRGVGESFSRGIIEVWLFSYREWIDRIVRGDVYR